MLKLVAYLGDIDRCDIFKTPSLNHPEHTFEMIKELELEATHLIDNLEPMLEKGQGSTGDSLLQKNRTMLILLHCLKNKKCQAILQFYESNIANSNLNKEAFFQNLLFLIEEDISLDEGKILLVKLLQLERYSIRYVSLLSENLYHEIANINPTAFSRRSKKIMVSLEQIQRLNLIKDCSKGYSEVILGLSTFIQDGIVKISHNNVWNQIINIVGTYDLDFYKVCDIIIHKITHQIRAENKDVILPLVKLIPHEVLGSIFSNKIVSPTYQPQLDFVYLCSIHDFTKISLQDIFSRGLYPYNHKYLKLARWLHSQQVYSINYLLRNLPYLQVDEIAQLDLKRRQIVASKIRQYTENNINHNQQKHNSNEAKQQILFGQLFGCFKLALLSQHARFNDFTAFEVLYRQLISQGTFDISMHVPTLNELVKTLQWITNPMLYEISPSKHFKVKCRVCQREKEGGYFQQALFPTLKFFENVTQLFNYIGVNIGYYNIVLCKLIRLFCSILSGKYFTINPFEKEIMKKNIWQITKKYLFPGITFQKQNFSLSMEMYELLRYYSQQQRFHIYRYYYEQIMFANPHLVVQFQHEYSLQRKMINKLNRMNQSKFETQLRSFAKRQHSHFFQSQFLLFTKSLNKKDKDQLSLYAKIFSSSTPIVPDIMLYLYLNYISKNQKSLVDQSGVFSPELQNIHSQIHLLLKKCSYLEPTMLIEFAIKQLAYKHQENLHKFLSVVRILKDIIAVCLPNPQQYNSSKQKFDFLTYGQLLRLQLSDKIAQYMAHGQLRKSLVKALCNPSGSRGSATYFYQLMNNLSARYNQINTENHKNMQDLCIMSDLCFQTMRSAIFLVFHQINWEKQIQKLSISKYFPISEAEILELLRGQNKIPFPLGCELLRSQKKTQISYHKNQVSSLKKLWDKVYKNVQLDQKTELQYLRPIKIFETNSFLLSEFYFYFWTSTMANLCDLNEKYKQIIGKIRTIISQRQIFNSNDDLQKSNKHKYLVSYNLLQKQEEQHDRSFKNFNNFLGKPEKNKKLSLEAKYTTEQGLKIFINLLFTNCLLPRMLINNCEAIYCSRVVFKIVKENSLPANKALQLIFYVVEATVSYVPYATSRELSCLSIFVSDFLRLFKNWDNFDEIQKVLRLEIGMEKFNENRFHKLKDYLQKYQQKLFSHLLINIHQPFSLRRVADFILSTEEIPFSANQVQRVIIYLSTLEIQTTRQEEEKSAKLLKQSMLNNLNNRKSKLPYFPQFDNLSDRASVISVGSVTSFSSGIKGSKNGKKDKS